jgi:hypothetical protein
MHVHKKEHSTPENVGQRGRFHVEQVEVIHPWTQYLSDRPLCNFTSGLSSPET